MKGVDTIARVRREYLVRGRSIREIARELHISRNTVRKILRSGETEFVYERTVQPQPKLGSWRAELDRLLAAQPCVISLAPSAIVSFVRLHRGVERSPPPNEKWPGSGMPTAPP